jgi:PAS domain S-box-containing protein
VERYLVEPADWPALRDTASGRKFVDCTYRRRDGTRVTGRTRLTVIRGATGQVQAVDGAVFGAAAAAVSGQEGLLDRAVEAADDAVAVVEADPVLPQSEIVYVNPAFAALTGYSVEEAVGATPRLLYGPSTDAGVLRTLRDHMEAEQPFRGETVLYRRDGTPYVGQWSVAPVRDGTGTVSHWVTVQRDVTEDRNARSTLQTADDRLEVLYTNFDSLLRAQTAEEVAAEVVGIVTGPLGLSRAVVREAAGDRLVPLALTGETPSTRTVDLETEHAAARAVRSGGSVVGDARLHLPLGRHGVLSVEHTPDGSPPVRLLDTLASHAAAVLDRIARAAAQRQAHERSDALRAAGRALLEASSGPAGVEAAFDALAPVLPDAARGRLLTFEREGERATVWAASAGALEGLNRGATWPVGAGLRRFLYDEALRVVDDLRETAPTALEEHLLQAGCRSMAVIPVRTEGAFRGVLLLTAEAPGAFPPARRALVEEAADLLGRTLRSAADDDSALRSAFLANVHHELRTPLTSIIGFAEVLSRQGGDAVTNRFADLIARSGRRLEDTFDDILTLSRLDADAMPFNPGPLSVAAEARAAVEAVEEQAREAGLSIEWEGPDEPLDAVLDRDGLQDVVRHLLDNAVTFTEAGGTVAVRLGAEDRFVVLVVADTGMGMEPAEVPELFAPFRQASTGLDRTHEGCGLGLTIVQRWVDVMGGTVDVDTAPGEGTTVTVRLPHGPVPEGR